MAAGDLCEAIDQVTSASLAAVFDTDLQRARALAQPRGAVTASSLDGLLHDPSVDMVYIGTPHDVLASTATSALLAGKHVLVEKPVGLSVDNVLRLHDLAGERSLRVGAMFVLRQSAAVLLARRLIGGGAIGAVTQVRIQTVVDKPPHYWWAGESAADGPSWRSLRARAGGGVLLMNSLHTIDAVRYITGLEFVSASAEVASVTHDIEVEDSAVAAFRLSNGALCGVVATAHSPGARAQETLEVDGLMGRVQVVDSPARDTVMLTLRRPWGDHDAGTSLQLRAPSRPLYRETLAAFVGVIGGQAGSAIEPLDAAAALAAVLAAYESACTGTRVSVAAIR